MIKTLSDEVDYRLCETSIHHEIWGSEGDATPADTISLVVNHDHFSNENEANLTDDSFSRFVRNQTNQLFP